MQEYLIVFQVVCYLKCVFVVLSVALAFANKRLGPNKFEITTKAQVTSTEIFMIYDRNQCTIVGQNQ